MEGLEEVLERLTVEDLKAHCRKMKIKNAKGNKQDIMNMILREYNKPNWLEDYFNSLEGFDKEYTYLIVQSNFCPINEEVRALKKKYNVKDDYNDKYKDNLAFSLKGYIPNIFKEKLLKLVPEVPMEIKPKEEVLQEEFNACDLIINDDNSINKFDEFLKFINSNKVKVTDKTKMITKANALKFINNLGIDEILRTDVYDLEEVRNAGDMLIVSSIIEILSSAGLIKVSDGYFKLGNKYEEYIKLNKIEKVKYLFNNYMESNINEIEHLTNYVYKTSGMIYLEMPRREILKYLKLFPINEWVENDELCHLMRIKDRWFLQKYTGEILQKDDYYNWFYQSEFEDLEISFIDTVLMYLSVLGLIDVTIVGGYNDRYERYFIGVTNIRLNEVGAIVLGLIDKDIEEENDMPLLINEDFKIIINKGVKAFEYELYFDRFLDKTIEDGNIIYKLDFAGFAKAYDIGIEPSEIISYLFSECEVIPDVVLDKFSKWMEYYDKINIKTITILEAPKEIMNKIKEYKKVKALEEVLDNEYIIIKKKKGMEIKKELEKRELFCNIIDD